MKIAICHYRTGGTDGVSLEIEKRESILKKLGCQVKLIAGPESPKVDFVIEELEWDNGIIPLIKENGYSYFQNNSMPDDELLNTMYETSDTIERKLTGLQLKQRFDAVLVHNIFSFGGHVPAARAFFNWIEKFKIPTIATHHDFHWERADFKVTRCAFLKKYLETYMPPKSKLIKHVTINSIARSELKKRFDIDADVVPDVFDFSQPEWKKDSFNNDFLENFGIRDNDLVILHATRILPRKGIELALDFASKLGEKIKQLQNKFIYNGKKINEEAKIFLVIAGYAEKEDLKYLAKLEEKVEKINVPIKFISNKIGAERSEKNGEKIYSLWDAYTFADLVTYTSLWEGWGNQFIEAIFAKKPIVIFEYPVFKKDIKPEGFQTISLGDGIDGKEDNGLVKLNKEKTKEATQKTINWLLDKKLNKKLQNNFEIGKKYHGYPVLEKFLVEKLAIKKVQ